MPFYSPALKMWGYTGFAMAFRDFVTCYVCGLTSMKLILHLVSKISHVYSKNSGHGPITLGFMSLGRFSKFKLHFA